MFRLVKVLNGNNQHETHKIGYSDGIDITPGCALVCTGGKASFPTATAMPDYIALSPSGGSAINKIDAMLVTEDMVFLVELTGTLSPTIGTSVGLSTKTSKMDSVSYNSNGKGTIVGIGDHGMVYVRFHK